MGICPSRKTNPSNQVSLKGKSDDNLVHLIPCSDPQDSKPMPIPGQTSKNYPQSRQRQRMDRVTVFQKKAANRERERSANLSPPQANGWLQQMKEAGATMSFIDAKKDPVAEDSAEQSVEPVKVVSEPPAESKHAAESATTESTNAFKAMLQTQNNEKECDWESFLKLKNEQRKSAYALPMSNDGTFTSSYQSLLSQSGPNRAYGQSTHNIVFAPSA